MAKGDSTKLLVGLSGNQTPQFRVVPFDLKFAAADTYKTGGFTIQPSDLGLSFIVAVISLAQGYHGAWTAPNLILSRQTAGTGALVEVPDNTDVSAISPIRCIAIGY